MKNKEIYNAFYSIPKRAERLDDKTLISTFVDEEEFLSCLLTTKNNQVIYGRRGTGKTHALRFIEQTVKETTEIAVYIDMRTLGSNISTYNEINKMPVSERATCLLVDCFAAIHEELVVYATSCQSCNINMSLLDEFCEAITEIQVIGEALVEREEKKELNDEHKEGLSIQLKNSEVAISLTDNSSNSDKRTQGNKTAINGKYHQRVHFGNLYSVFSKILKDLKNKQIWILLDEWSSIPQELQPYLADLIRRALFPHENITVKISAIEFRSVFQISQEHGEYIGIELGADIAADLNLDDFFIFENNRKRSTTFFKNLIFHHYKRIIEQNNNGNIPDSLPNSADDLIEAAFENGRVFYEFIRSSEGIPRDCINILSIASQRAGCNLISYSEIHRAVRDWSQRDKHKSLSANTEANKFLNYLGNQLVQKQKKRVFLTSQFNVKISEIIDSLFDYRVIHLRQEGYRNPSRPDEIFNVYVIDYGSYLYLSGVMVNSEKPLEKDELVPKAHYKNIMSIVVDEAFIENACR